MKRNTVYHLLDQMPTDREGAKAWLASLRFGEFDQLWCSAVTTLVAEFDCSAGEIASFMPMVRERYRDELRSRLKHNRAVQFGNHMGEHNPNARLNEMQVRIIRHCNAPRSTSFLASVFKVGRDTIRRVRTGKNWRLAA